MSNHKPARRIGTLCGTLHHLMGCIVYKVKQQQEQSCLSRANTAIAAGTAGVSRGPGHPKGSESVVENADHDNFEDVTTIIVTFHFKNYANFCSAIALLFAYIFLFKLL